MDDGWLRQATARAPRRKRWPAWLRRFAPWTLAGVAVVLAALWVWTALTSNHSTPWYNDWLVILVLYAVFVALAAPRIVFPRLRVLGVDDGYVHVENSDGIRAFALVDGVVDDSRRPSEGIAQGWTVADADPSGSMTAPALGDGFASVERGVLSISDDDYWREEAQAVGSGHLVIQEETYRGPLRYDRVLRTVDAATARTIDEISIPERVRGGMTAPTGTSIVILEGPGMSTTDLVTISPDGTFSRSTIGRTGFFSEAL